MNRLLLWHLDGASDLLLDGLALGNEVLGVLDVLQERIRIRIINHPLEGIQLENSLDSLVQDLLPLLGEGRRLVHELGHHILEDSIRFLLWH